MAAAPRRFAYAPFILAAAVQCLLLRAATRSIITHSDATLPPPPDPRPSITNDGLVWIAPKPREPRRVGWEDDWMMQWKRRHYSFDQRMGCNSTEDTPYDDELLCSIPGYVPARLPPPTERGPPSIPRVIFISWFERRLGRAMYTSLLTLLHHNPEYELVFFDDADVDRCVCDNVGSSPEDFAVPLFSKAKAGAMRADIWRLLIVHKYGGVYLDSDISALGRLPIEWDDAAVSGVGCWSHLPSKTGGLFEHWAMAFGPRHPFIDEAVAAMTRNLERPEYLLRRDTPEAAREDSVTMRLTGPAMYQNALHVILEKAQCQKDDNSYCGALLEPERYCKDMDTFRSYFNHSRFFEGINLGNAISHKLFYPAHPWVRETEDMQPHYDDPEAQMSKEADSGFCSAEAFAERAASRERHWKEKIQENNNSSD